MLIHSLTTGDASDEAQRFLGLARDELKPPSPAPAGSQEAARRLFAMSKPIAGTLAESYLRGRGIVDPSEALGLRFHPRCFYRADAGSPDGAHNAWPALLATVTDRDGRMTGLQRTWLDPSGHGKAPVTTPHRAMGHLLGHAVRFGPMSGDVMAAGEGIETVLSLRGPLPEVVPIGWTGWRPS